MQRTEGSRLHAAQGMNDTGFEFREGRSRKALRVA
jgi:hypothetical protein